MMARDCKAVRIVGGPRETRSESRGPLATGQADAQRCLAKERVLLR